MRAPASPLDALALAALREGSVLSARAQRFLANWPHPSVREAWGASDSPDPAVVAEVLAGGAREALAPLLQRCAHLTSAQLWQVAAREELEVGTRALALLRLLGREAEQEGALRMLGDLCRWRSGRTAVWEAALALEGFQELGAAWDALEPMVAPVERLVAVAGSAPVGRARDALLLRLGSLWPGAGSSYHTWVSALTRIGLDDAQYRRVRGYVRAYALERASVLVVLAKLAHEREGGVFPGEPVALSATSAGALADVLERGSVSVREPVLAPGGARALARGLLAVETWAQGHQDLAGVLASSWVLEAPELDELSERLGPLGVLARASRLSRRAGVEPLARYLRRSARLMPGPRSETARAASSSTQAPRSGVAAGAQECLSVLCGVSAEFTPRDRIELLRTLLGALDSSEELTALWQGARELGWEREELGEVLGHSPLADLEVLLDVPVGMVSRAAHSALVFEHMSAQLRDLDALRCADVLAGSFEGGLGDLLRVVASVEAQARTPVV